VEVAPRELKGVVADLLDFAKLEVTARNELDRSPMTLAVGARTIPAEDLVGQDRFVAVAPLDLHNV
jgi:hypothetical protein